jgi:hypothetical protein
MMPTPRLLDVNMLEGNYLDNAVQFALGLKEDYDGETGSGSLADGTAILLTGDPAASPFLRSFCREWSVGGPLIDHYHIGLNWEEGAWTSTFGGLTAWGTTALVAAMRVLVLYRFTTGRKLQQLDGLTRLEALQQIYRRPQDIAVADSPRPAPSTPPPEGE